MNNFDRSDYWRAIILYGRNTATYKIALAKCLLDFVGDRKTNITMHELATSFFNEYGKRLKKGMPQLDNPARQTVMENVVTRYNLGVITKDKAIEYVEANAFGDVITRYHTVNNFAVPVKFYEHNENGLVLTDSLFEVFENQEQASCLINEVESRWDLLEAAFLMRREDSYLENDIRSFYLMRGYERKNITNAVPVLNGYQNDICFYCGESMIGHDVHVDHVIPRQLVYHDEIWNLVLAHSFCNEQKGDSIPDISYIHKLIIRNEHYIHSNHPIKNRIIKTTGTTQDSRRKFIERAYWDAREVIKRPWGGIPGYRPDKDPFLRSYIRNIVKI